MKKLTTIWDLEKVLDIFNSWTPLIPQEGRKKLDSSLDRVVCIVVVMGLLAGIASADVFNMGGGQTSLEMVTVGNPGNVGELSGGGNLGPYRVCGAVDYVYNIGKYEVTAGQYTEFLNAVAATDMYGLYYPSMDYDAYPSSKGCNIKRDGSPGSYTYSVASDWANRPVNWVSWSDAARFANWLTNGQITGSQDLSTTEDGSYYLNGATSDDDLLAAMRKSPQEGGRYYTPSEDEWYKAAYHKNNGVTGNYWDYTMGSNSTPTNDLIDPDPGNNANFEPPADGPLGAPYYRTEVGAFENSASSYGTFDQGGNVAEYNETLLFEFNEGDLAGPYRGLRGGSYSNTVDRLHAEYRRTNNRPTHEHANTGFRIVDIPEPATISLLMLGSAWSLMRRRPAGG